MVRPTRSAYPFGRDVLTRVLQGARLSLFIGLSVAWTAGAIGTLIDIGAGHFRCLESLLMRCVDALLAFPAIVLAIGIGAALGPQGTRVIIALGVLACVPRGAPAVAGLRRTIPSNGMGTTGDAAARSRPGRSGCSPAWRSA